MSIEDRAQDQEVADWERNNRPRDRRIFAPGEEGYGPECCAECGDEMPEVRRAYGYALCVSCAADLERIRSRGL